MKIFGFLALSAVIWAAGALTAWADDDMYPPKGLSIGGRASWYQVDPGGVDHDWHGGAQVRLHMTNTWALEGSADYRQRKLNGVTTDIIPVQGSLMAYIVPNKTHIAPFLLAGVGWYYTHVRQPIDSTQHRFGGHVGGGVEFYLSRHWSIDGSYRHIWVSSISTPSTTSNQKFRDDGHMITAGLNYHF